MNNLQNLQKKPKTIHHIDSLDMKVISKEINKLVHSAMDKSLNHICLSFTEDVRENNNLVETLDQMIRTLVASQYRVNVLSENIDENINMYYINISWIIQPDMED